MALAGSRLVIEAVTPSIDCGRFAAKAVKDRPMTVEADIFCDGPDTIGAALLARAKGARTWRELPMRHIENDRWRASLTLAEIGAHEFTIFAWRDLFASWQADTAKKHAAGQDIALELVEGVELVHTTAGAAQDEDADDRAALTALADALSETSDQGVLFGRLMDGATTALMRRCAMRTDLTTMDAPLPVWVDREKALVSAWYELMPRSMAFDESRHGTFDDVIAHLPYVRDLGFDVLYFPPIHPIGTTNRKGRNNALSHEPGDRGSPYAIGSHEGGHDAIHPELGSFADFERLVAAAAEHGLEIALDFAIQCSPDHPWIREHPEWFDWRPDGTIKFAENPPKKYEDIVNVHFYRKAIPSLWLTLRDVVRFWIGHGVKIFRVDNPHTKPLPFWEWLIGEIRAEHPEVIFLSEAFTRPKMMKRLAKLGFSQSYTYFTWRNTKAELIQYLSELTTGDMPAVMRPNFFTNTPDINPVILQSGGRPAHRSRLVLAATLSPSYGIYNGFEICEATPIPGKEEYLDSEKYQLRKWDFDRPGHIKDDIELINRLRNTHPALRQLDNLRFYNAWNDHVLYYAKFTDDWSDVVLIAVNLDPFHAQGADIEVPLWEFGLPDDARIDGVDLVTGEHFSWDGKHQHVWLTPDERPYAIWALENPAVVAS
ncbi:MULTISPECIES: alpha-1,4-glucan--maltose-1-phosphate maltosyltransferase [unclassified Roseitalea]|uniref:alpha-1,4-glucan--maltose-1-phosphate maltosyltransferase n=1 Tax=unclassified Roseitalea TaxID=2639107 RepID=UPI00273F219C|nr:MULTISPECIES: alpha-1,4-glucan--maltose-1-phosphate maltosyltransferase [unclassified Roseitalea]